jgi:Uma2 family endonuclease
MASPAILEPQVLPPGPRTDDALYEVVNGSRVELPPVGAYSTFIASRLDQEIGPFSITHGLGLVVCDMLFVLDAQANLRRRPDVAFVSAERWPLDQPISELGDWEVIPDLAVEVISPDDTFDEMLAKVHEYFSKGVRQVWIVVPRRQQIYVYDSPNEVGILSATDELQGGSLLPGFRLPVARLFQRQSETETPTPV